MSRIDGAVARRMEGTSEVAGREQTRIRALSFRFYETCLAVNE